ncbi:MAG: ASKHA domain-containing protein [Candidatus Altiarchaeales archaeon]|nr:DUF4445 domain-containing protein [Candidatus Altiarchaeota archaeon]MBU4342259.1 DUF4445 domain-containing protein [Candidatus Altiarchaeota archaeon]MBU4406577.1 DUF4445 domain-containing protein [Candidatus Altiarchaeota archaeon]MBU4436945.1 DUF4445 domain-containing protein [Candidatus Altiarchaeota archaeon]MCG2782110.1 ASKHA domain-containing protein [Candidatus Altiarchaeales archaeon]
MSHKIRFLPEGTEAEAKNSILETAIANGVHINSSCNGLGKCGKCRVIVQKGEFRSEATELLTQEEKKKGYALACQSFPESDLEVLIPPESRLGEHQILERIDSGIAEMRKKSKSAGESLGLAIDIGTTTVVAYLTDLDSGNIIDTESQLNKQSVFGADVLSRINQSKETGGLEKLNSLILENINGLTEILLERNFFGDSKEHHIKKIVTAGNTVMTYLLLGRDPSAIQKNQQLEEFRQPALSRTADIGIDCGNPKAELYCLPGIANYVGGDIVADIMASGMHLSDGISMLIDVGTNGEIALGNKEFLITCSTSAGPAFEGGETKHGMRASTGAIEKVEIDDDITYAVINNDRPRGICGSGLIDLISELFLNEIIDPKGKFISDSRLSDRIRTGESGPEFVVVPREEAGIDSDIVITEKDIENIIITKAAIYAGASTLTRVGTPFDQLDKIYIAGGFGHYINVERAIVLGLLPDLPKEKFEFIGNGSVLGAQLCLTSDEKRKEAQEIAKRATYLDLSKERSFTEEYMNASYLPHNNMDLFPTVEEKL